ncbi:carboxypeptidase-like regulatory domain-containing protein, partial [Bacteroidales bacterium OttesenSCG-928-M11]|nr:carboxypeptidase-like regulatory domain-containing protein [Bacteroidales bacterium OttesenSCG-928-M11]
MKKTLLLFFMLMLTHIGFAQAEVVISYNDGTPDPKNHFSTTGTEYDVAVKCTSESLATLEVGKITSVKTYLKQGDNPPLLSAVLKIWQAGAEIYTQDLSSITYNAWMEIKLDTPVDVDTSKGDLYIGFSCSVRSNLMGYMTADVTLDYPGIANLYRLKGNSEWLEADSSMELGDWSISVIAEKKSVTPGDDKYTLSFNVLDEQNQPVSDAILTFDGKKQETGVYTFSNLSEGDYVYSVEKEKYYTASGKVTLNENKTINVQLHAIAKDTYLNVLHKGSITDDGEPMAIYYNDGI